MKMNFTRNIALFAAIALGAYGKALPGMEEKRRLNNEESQGDGYFDPHDESLTLLKAVCNIDSSTVKGKIFLQQQTNLDGEPFGKTLWSASITGLPT